MRVYKVFNKIVVSRNEIICLVVCNLHLSIYIHFLHLCNRFHLISRQCYFHLNRFHNFTNLTFARMHIITLTKNKKTIVKILPHQKRMHFVQMIVWIKSSRLWRTLNSFKEIYSKFKNFIASNFWIVQFVKRV